MKIKDNKLNNKKHSTRGVNFTLFLMSLPVIVWLFLFHYLPIFGVSIAFMDYNPVMGFAGSEWVGLDNFKFFFQSNDAFRTIRNTVVYNLAFIIVNHLMYLIVALCWYEMTKKATKAYQTIMLIPSCISWVLVAYIAFGLLSHDNGILTEIIYSISGKEVLWYSEPKYWPYILTLFNLWKNVGTGTILFYAALMAIDTSLFEAAKLDGANKMQQILYVSLPSIMPTVVIVIIMAVGGIMNGDFGLFFQVPRDSGALYATTDVLETYVYRGLKTGSFSQSAAVGLFKSMVGLIMVLLTNAFAKKVDPDYAMF